MSCACYGLVYTFLICYIVDFVLVTSPCVVGQQYRLLCVVGTTILLIVCCRDNNTAYCVLQGQQYRLLCRVLQGQQYRLLCRVLQGQ